MDAFSEFDRYLDQSFSVDYWADEGVLQAHRMISRFDAPDWEKLQDQWNTRSGTWQERCAQVLPFGEPAPALLAAVRFLGSSDSAVRFAALDSLREMNLACLSPADIALVGRIAERDLPLASPLETLIIRALISQVERLDGDS